jgi:Ca2+-binding EF-hand superfamily protein
MFLLLDTSGDGFLEKEEVQNGLRDSMGEFRVLTSEWEELLEALDYHLGGKIAYTQFINVAVSRAHLL